MLVDDLKNIVGPGGWTSDAVDLQPHLTEWRDVWSGKTLLLVSPDTTEQVSSIFESGERVSSSAIRDALWNGELDKATALLGRHYRMSGNVILGERMGRELGYPTANVNLKRRQSAVMGIFAVRQCQSQRAAQRLPRHSFVDSQGLQCEQ